MSSSAVLLKKVIHAKFLVQSTVKGPDFLLHRINEFLAMVRDKQIAELTDEILETNKQALINNLL